MGNHPAAALFPVSNGRTQHAGRAKLVLKWAMVSTSQIKQNWLKTA
jgi:hypothetical protein